VFAAVGNFGLRKLGYAPFAALPKFRDYVGPGVALVVSFFLVGLGYWLMARSMAPEDAPLAALPIFVCAVVVVVIGGFLAFFAPAGLGVQEGLLLLLLTPMMAPEHKWVVAVIAVLMRLVQTLSEVLMALMGLAIVRLTRPPAPAPAA
jgi:hypothetical protein